MNTHLDYDHSKMLKDLGFDQTIEAGDRYIATMSSGKERDFLLSEDEDKPYKEFKAVKMPAWWEVKQWLWDKHGFVFCVDTNILGERYCVVRDKTVAIIIPEKIDTSDDVSRFDSPIKAEIDAIKSAINFLIEKIK